MTNNQIQYAKVLEDTRAHMASEANVSEQNRINAANTLIREQELGEAVRSHMASETLQAQQIHSNYLIGMANVTEASRHNQAVEYEQRQKDIHQYQQQERYQRGVMAETNRHNIAAEDIQRTTAEASLIGAIANGAGTAISTGLKFATLFG